MILFRSTFKQAYARIVFKSKMPFNIFGVKKIIHKDGFFTIRTANESKIYSQDEIKNIHALKGLIKKDKIISEKGGF